MGIKGKRCVFEVIDGFHKQLDALIELNHKIRKSLSDDLGLNYAPADFAANFCTVRCDIGRMTGKSEYIRNRANSRSLVIAAGENQRMCDFGEVGFDVFTALQIVHGATKKKTPYEMIYIDNPYFVFKRVPAEVIYSLLAVEGEHQTFVLLGE